MEDILKHIFHTCTILKHNCFPRYFITKVSEFIIFGCPLAVMTYMLLGIFYITN